MPPRKSTPKLRPRTGSTTIVSTTPRIDTASQKRIVLKKSKLGVSEISRKRIASPQIVSVFGRRRSNHMAIKSRDSEIAVNIEQTRPSASVMPKPRTGPEPMT